MVTARQGSVAGGCPAKPAGPGAMADQTGSSADGAGGGEPVLAADVRHRPGEERHFLAIGSTLFFCIGIFAEPSSLVTPAVAVATYFAADKVRKLERPPFDALNLLLVVLAVALFYFMLSNLVQMDTIFGFNLSFAALAAGISARFAQRLWRCVLVVIVAWAAMSVRTYWAVGQSQAGLVFTLLGLGAIILVAIAGWMLRRNDFDRPWMMLGALSMTVGLATLPLWPVWPKA